MQGDANWKKPNWVPKKEISLLLPDNANDGKESKSKVGVHCCCDDSR